MLKETKEIENNQKIVSLTLAIINPIVDSRDTQVDGDNGV